MWLLQSSPLLTALLCQLFAISQLSTAMPVVHESPSLCAWSKVREDTVQNMQMVSTGAYYSSYHGHEPEHLLRARDILVQRGCKKFIYLLGDSSLDNKHWFFSLESTSSPDDPEEARKWITSTANCKVEQLADPNFLSRYTGNGINGFEHVLDPPRMVKDVAYWLNVGLEKRAESQVSRGEKADNFCALMTSVEESTIADRDQRLLVQDAFVRDHITEDDYLIVSVGGNDVALAPTLWTIINMFFLTCSPDWLIRMRWAPGFRHFVNLFGSRVAALTQRVVAQHRPKKMLLSMIYYLAEQPGGSWADDTLSKLGYNTNPKKLQLIIRTLFEAIRERRQPVAGSSEGVHLFPLFAVLDPKDSANYCERVEPSVEGGRQMAEALLEVLFADDAEAAIDQLLLRDPVVGKRS